MGKTESPDVYPQCIVKGQVNHLVGQPQVMDSNGRTLMKNSGDLVRDRQGLFNGQATGSLQKSLQCRGFGPLKDNV